MSKRMNYSFPLTTALNANNTAWHRVTGGDELADLVDLPCQLEDQLEHWPQHHYIGEHKASQVKTPGTHAGAVRACKVYDEVRVRLYESSSQLSSPLYDHPVGFEV